MHNEKSNKRGKQMYMDRSLIKRKSGGGSKFWYFFVDEATGLKQSIFTLTKSHFRPSISKKTEKQRDKCNKYSM